jgi:hypothetical protein
MGAMSTSGTIRHGVRASDAERDEIAQRLHVAAGDGRLTLAELDERLAIVYAARLRDELAEPVGDLPAPVAPGPPARRFAGDGLLLTVHAVLVVAVVVAVLVRWVLAGPDYFWPVFPIVWAVASLMLHARRRR